MTTNSTPPPTKLNYYKQNAAKLLIDAILLSDDDAQYHAESIRLGMQEVIENILDAALEQQAEKRQQQRRKQILESATDDLNNYEFVDSHYYAAADSVDNDIWPSVENLRSRGFEIYQAYGTSQGARYLMRRKKKQPE